MSVSEFLSSKVVTSHSAFKTLFVVGIITIILTIIALPLGLIGLAAMLYLYFICRPLLPVLIQDEAQIVAPAEGFISSITTSERGTHIRIQQRWDSRLHVAMPVAGRIEQNLYIDGAYLPETDTSAIAINARRELLIETDGGASVELVIWATPLGRLQFSDMLEGQIEEQGAPCGLSILAGTIEMIVPSSWIIDMSKGAFCIAGQTVIGHRR